MSFLTQSCFQFWNFKNVLKTSFKFISNELFKIIEFVHSSNKKENENELVNILFFVFVCQIVFLKIKIKFSDFNEIS